MDTLCITAREALDVEAGRISHRISSHRVAAQQCKAMSTVHNQYGIGQRIQMPREKKRVPGFRAEC